MTRIQRILGLAVAGSIAVALGGCVGSDLPKVTLDIYSGRENPTWELADGTRDKVASAIDLLDEGESAGMLPGLGFRGFEISSLSTRWGDGSAVTVLEGVVLIDPSGDEPTVLIDDDSTVLALLIEDARTHVDDDVLSELPQP